MQTQQVGGQEALQGGIALFEQVSCPQNVVRIDELDGVHGAHYDDAVGGEGEVVALFHVGMEADGVGV